MQKVITVSFLPSWDGNDTQFVEFEFPTLKKYLEEGYQVAQVHTANPGGGLRTIVLTFVLIK